MTEIYLGQYTAILKKIFILVKLYSALASSKCNIETPDYKQQL